MASASASVRVSSSAGVRVEGGESFGNAEVGCELCVLPTERVFHPCPGLRNDTSRDPEKQGAEDDGADQRAHDESPRPLSAELVWEQRHVDRRQRTEPARLLLLRRIGAHRTLHLSAGPAISKGRSEGRRAMRCAATGPEKCRFTGLTPLRVGVKTPLPPRWT